MLRPIAVVFFLALLAPFALAQNMVELQAVKDNTLYEDAGGNFSNGAGDGIFAGTTQRDNLIRRGLVAFDLTNALPEGAIVDSVQIQLTMNRSLGTRHFVHLHRVTRDWGEGTSNPVGQGGGGTTATDGDATWLHAVRPGVLWTTPGGDFRSANSGEISILSEGPAIWYNTASLLADVNDWLADPAQNFGWLVMGDETTNGTGQRFASREHADVNDRPVLRIFHSGTATYTESGEQPESFALTGAWPNPFSTSLSLSVTSDHAQRVQIEAIDIQGRIVERFSRWLQPGPQSLALGGHTWPSGLYLIRVQGDAVTQSASVVKL